LPPESDNRFNERKIYEKSGLSELADALISAALTSAAARAHRPDDGPSRTLQLCRTFFAGW
jgi:hypothetical protein